MTTILRIFVGEGWPQEPRTHWALLNAAGELLQEGVSDALRWPLADKCEAVFSAPQASCLRVNIPHRVSRQDRLRVVASALEDRLLDDPDRCHLTAFGSKRGEADVLVMTRERLRNVLTQFEALQRPLSAAFSELQSNPGPAQGWVLVLTPAAAILHRPQHPPLSIDLVGDMPPPLLSALAAAEQKAAGEIALTIALETGRTIDLARWKTALGTALVLGEAYRWYRVGEGAVNLLHGEFMPRQRRGNVWHLIRLPFRMAAFAVALHLLVGTAQVAWQRHRVGQMEERMTALFQIAFPDMPAMAPPVQVRQQLDRLRTAHGEMRSDDALALLAVVADGLGAEGRDAVREIRYENRHLSIVFTPALAAYLDGLQRRLAVQGIAASVTTASGQPSLTLQQELPR